MGSSLSYTAADSNLSYTAADSNLMVTSLLEVNSNREDGATYAVTLKPCHRSFHFMACFFPVVFWFIGVVDE